MIKTLVKNSLFTVVSQIIILLLGLVFAGMTIKYLGAGKAGFFILISSILGWVNLAGGGAFHLPAVKYIAEFFDNKKKKKTLSVVRTVVTANLITGLPFAILPCLIFPTLFSWSKLNVVDKESAFMVVVLIAASFLFDQYSSAIRSVYEGLQRFDILSIVKVIVGIVSNFLRLFVLVLYQDMVILALANLIISILTLILDLFLVNYLIGYIIVPGWKKGILSSFLNFGMWAWLGNTSNIILFNLTSIILTRSLGTATLMYVALPQSITLAVSQFIISVSYLIFPFLSNQKEFSFDVMARIEDRMRWLISLVSFFIFCGLSISGPILFTLLVDQDFSNHASLSLSIFCVFGILWSLEVFHVFATISIGNIKINTITNLVTSILGLSLTIILIPIIGYIGHPISQLIRFPVLIWHTIWTRKILRLPNQFKKICSSFTAPLLAIIFWAVFVFTMKYYFNPNIIFELLLIFVGAILSLHIVVLIEKFYYPNLRRLELVDTILSPFIKKINPKLYFHFNNYLK